MKKQKIICTILATVMGLSLFSLGGCGGKKTDPVVQLNVKTPLIKMVTPSKPEITTSGDFLTLAVEAFAKQYTKEKVEISVRMFPSGFEEEFVTNTIGTEDAADVLYDDFYNMIAYVHSGIAIPLEGLLTDDARADLKQDYLEWGQVSGTTQNGVDVSNRIYMLPFVGRQNILMYNKALLNECGLSEYVSGETGVIQNWSLEDWNYILDTLAEKLAIKSEQTGVQYAPTMMYAKDRSGDTHIMSLLIAFGNGMIADDRGYFDFTEEKALQGIEWLQSGLKRPNGYSWYMPNPQAFTMSDCDRLFHSGQIAFYSFNIGSVVYAGGREEVEKYGYVNFPGGENGRATRFVTGFEIFDNQDARKLAVAKDFVKFIYETEEWLNASAGNISVSKRVTAAQEAENMLMIDQFTANIKNVVHFMRGNPNWQGRDNSVRNVFYKNIAELLSGKVTPKECALQLNTECNAATDYGWENSKLHD